MELRNVVEVLSKQELQRGRCAERNVKIVGLYRNEAGGEGHPGRWRLCGFSTVSLDSCSIQKK
jgi:hypothetical protein